MVPSGEVIVFPGGSVQRMAEMLGGKPKPEPEPLVHYAMEKLTGGLYRAPCGHKGLNADEFAVGPMHLVEPNVTCEVCLAWMDDF